MAEGGEQDALTEGPPNNLEDKYGDEDAPKGDLLTLPPAEAAKANYKAWKDQPKEALSRRRAEWRVNAWRREGKTNVYAQKVQDKGIWKAWEPPWTAPPVPVLNKADRLCRRLKNITFADPPRAEAVPSTGEEQDQEAARFTVRVLEDIQSESNLDDLRAANRAFDRASVYGSGFIRYYIDEQGGGLQPVRIMAKRGALSADAPFTGPNGEDLPGEPVARYVSASGELLDSPAGAARRWMPALKKEILNPSQIRFIPHDAEDIWDASGIIVGSMPTWGEIEDAWPAETEKIDKEARAKIFSFHPDKREDLVGLDAQSKREGNNDDLPERLRRVAVFTTYHRASPLYPKGCYFIGLGDSVMLHREPWVYEPEDGDPENLEIPVTQYMQYESSWSDPFGQGLMHLMGNGAELRSAQVGHLLQYLDQFAGRRTFLPTNSIIQPKQLQQMAGSTIPMNPGGKPEYEDIPPFPSAPMELYGLVSEEMDDHSMLQETGTQGGEVSGVTSGKQVALLTQNAMASLSEIRSNTERAYLRACRIQAQQIRKGYTVPQQIGWTGEDGQYRQQWWSGSDLRGTADFKLKKGTLSMMTPEQKMNMTLQFKQMGLYDQAPDLFEAALTNTMGPIAGLEEDPSRARIKRQLAAWSAGPPQGFMERQAAAAAQMAAQPLAAGPAGTPAPLDQMGQPPVPGVPEMDPAAAPGAPAGGMPAQPGNPMEPAAGPQQLGPPPLDPALASIFDLVKADELPDVATVRLSELKRFMATTRYTRWPPEWRVGVEVEFDHMKLCAGVQTVPEQQAAQQQAAEQQQQQADQQMQQQHQQQIELEMAKAQSQRPPERKPLDMKIDRDPTGRAARIREQGPPPATN